MRRQLLAITVAIGAMTTGTNAQALLVAGWDFSQYFGDGLLSIDGETYTDTLGANYSSLVRSEDTPSGIPGVGPAAASFGTMYLNGQFGSSSQDLGSGNETFLPSQVFYSLSSNLTAPVADGILEFDSHTTLVYHGQTFANQLVMTALGQSSVVFQATPSLPGMDWVFSFGGRTQSGNGSVAVEFSTDGVDFVSRGVIPLNEIDSPYTVALGADLAEVAFVRLGFSGNAEVIDNVAINATLVPEPGTALLLLGGLAGLTAYGRRSAR